MDSRTFERLNKIYQLSRPILLVLILAALIVFINSYPNVPSIASETNDYRQQVKSKISLNETEKEEMIIKPPPPPSIPNTITPVISPEEVNKIVNPQPKPKPKPGAPDEQNQTIIDTTPESSEPPLEIKLFTGFLNVAPLIFIAALGGFGIYLLFKYKKHFTLRSMFGVAIALVAICTIVFFSIIAVEFIQFLYDFDWDINLIGWLLLPLAVILGGILSHFIIAKRTSIFKRNIGLAFVGGLMGAFLAVFLPFWIIFILLIAITLFDIYSVKFGPIKKIMELENEVNSKKVEKKNIIRTLDKQPILEIESVNKDSTNTESENLKSVNTNVAPESENISNKSKQSIMISEPIKSLVKPSKALIQKSPKKIFKLRKKEEEFDLMLMYDNPDWSLGFGDFVIYSMFTSAVLTYTMIYLPYYIFYSPLLGLILPWLVFFLCTIGLLVGFFITLKLLEKRDYLPGLPISIGLGFIVFISCIIILQVINYILFNEFAIII